MEAAMPGGVLLRVTGAAMDGTDVFVFYGMRQLFSNFLSGDFVLLQIVTPAKAGANKQHSRASEANNEWKTAHLSENDDSGSQQKSRNKDPFSVHGNSPRNQRTSRRTLRSLPILGRKIKEIGRSRG